VRLSVDAIIEVQAVYPFYAKFMELLADFLSSGGQGELDGLMAAHADAQARIQQSYRRFLELVRRLDESSELADFLSIHQRLRTKLAALLEYLEGRGAIAPPRRRPTSAEPATPTPA
jgi:hypothetical protein